MIIMLIFLRPRCDMNNFLNCSGEKDIISSTYFKRRDDNMYILCRILNDQRDIEITHIADMLHYNKKNDAYMRKEHNLLEEQNNVSYNPLNSYTYKKKKYILYEKPKKKKEQLTHNIKYENMSHNDHMSNNILWKNSRPYNKSNTLNEDEKNILCLSKQCNQKNVINDFNYDEFLKNEEKTKKKKKNIYYIYKKKNNNNKINEINSVQHFNVKKNILSEKKKNPLNDNLKNKKKIGQIKFHIVGYDKKKIKNYLTPSMISSIKKNLKNKNKKMSEDVNMDKSIGGVLPFFPSKEKIKHKRYLYGEYFMRSSPNKENIKMDTNKNNKEESIINEKLLKNLQNISLSSRIKDIQVEEGSERKIKEEDNNIKEQGNSFKKYFKGVVKLYVDITEPSLEMIWQNNPPKSITGSGFIIEGHLILTNAHNISYSTRILIRKHGNSGKYESKILFVAHDVDIAILTVEDKTFFDDVYALHFGPLPSLKDEIITMGYPSGGDKLSVTEGIVSRIDVQYYKHSNYKFLLTQIDAPLNPGNSGGPALVKEKVVGICFQSYKASNNISYIIPSTIISHVLLDIHKNKKYTGYVFLGVKYEPLENPYLREALGLAELERKKIIKQNVGILITEVFEGHMSKQQGKHYNVGDKYDYMGDKYDYMGDKYNYLGDKYNYMGDKYNYMGDDHRDTPEMDASCTYILNNIRSDKKKIYNNNNSNNNNNNSDNNDYMCGEDTNRLYGLKINDIILSVDDKQINNDGTVILRDEETVGFEYLFNNKFINDICNIKIVRNKKIKIIIIKLYKVEYLLKQHNWDKRNKYFIYGGIVFSILTRSLYLYAQNAEIDRLLLYNHFKKKSRDEIVILKNILPTKITTGYYYTNSIVLRVNNIIVKNLKHFIQLIEMIKYTHKPKYLTKNKYTLQNFKNYYNKNITSLEINKIIHILILTTSGQQVPIVLNKRDVEKYSEEIKKIYSITSDRYVY
ncbi:serine protease DegP [Plasmodium gaboni]|uniref:Serine protease DegP n=1 Tax=Plasmodium gaboni TaxID=647221 RepID=A0A151LN74_9APIC|nr:serine protease DegP [Plasmodium gaboni]KYO00680.1 serine protease DegP [Plasmodium gaboni]